MRRIFIGLILLSFSIMLGCDKPIKEAARPAGQQNVAAPANS